MEAASREPALERGDPRAERASATPSPHEHLRDLVERYGRLVASAIQRAGGPRAADRREDIAQDVFLALWRQVRNERTIEHPASYLYRSAVRETVRTLRRSREEPLAVLEVSPATAPRTPADELEDREARQRLRIALRRLAPARGRAVRSHLAGFSVQEIMAMEEWSYQKARNLVARGMADLRRELAAVDPDAGAPDSGDGR